MYYITKVEEVIKEGEGLTTIRFRLPFTAYPGQFVMVWLPDVDSVPMSLSYLGDLKGITSKRIGEATRKIESLKIGDIIGIDGPLGNHFKLRGKKILVIAGGSGIASLITLVEYAKSLGKEVHVIFGTKTKSEIVFEERIKNNSDGYIITTDDGSYGKKGTTIDALFEILDQGFDEIITCGPEVMMKRLFEISIENNILFQAAVERVMKCGHGICDSCNFGGFLVCKDGPVFNEKDLISNEEFGKSRLDRSGKRIFLR
ncbi:MAG: dihydroorotate dehydrogenase electron transfer subunit [Thermoplasmata archaeon]